MNENGKKELKFWSITVAVLLVVTLIIIGLATQGGSSSQITLTDKEWVKGNPQSKVSLVEYSDFQCPACAGFQKYFKEVLEPAYADKIRIIYRNFPLTQVHAQAQLAAQAAEAAGLQNKFWEMHDQLFAKQSEWSGAMDPRSLFIKYATDLGLDIEKFKADIDSPAVKDAVSEDVISGTQANVPGTPSFFLNGKTIKIKQSYDELRGLLDQAIQNQ